MGYRNYRYFVLFLFYTSLATGYIAGVLTPSVFRADGMIRGEDGLIYQIVDEHYQLMHILWEPIPRSYEYTKSILGFAYDEKRLREAQYAGVDFPHLHANITERISSLRDHTPAHKDSVDTGDGTDLSDKTEKAGRNSENGVINGAPESPDTDTEHERPFYHIGKTPRMFKRTSDIMLNAHRMRSILDKETCMALTWFGSITVSIVLCSLLFYHSYLITSGQTTIEHYHSTALINKPR